MMTVWLERGIPLAVVLEAIDTVFDRRLERGESVEDVTLWYCRHAVERAALERERLMTPAPARETADALESWQRRLAGQLEQAAGRLEPLRARPDAPAGLEEMLDEWRALAGRLAGGAPPARRTVMDRLAGWDEAVGPMLQALLGPEQLPDVEAQVDGTLGPHEGRMSAEVFRETRRRAVISAVRMKLGFPRLAVLAETPAPPASSRGFAPPEN